jgi:hypothetical protein
MKLLPMPVQTTSDANREGAAAMYDLYQSYVSAGFTKQQAMQMLCTMIAETVKAQKPK